MALSERLRTAREAKDLSQSALARAANVSLRNIWLIEHGDRADIKRDTAEKLAAVVGCSVEWLMLGIGNGPENREQPKAS